MRKLTIALLASLGTALALPAAAQVVYQAVPSNAAVVAAPANPVVVAPSAPIYAYVAPVPTNNYSYSNSNYSYNKYTDASGCTVETIRDYGSLTTHRNCY